MAIDGVVLAHSSPNVSNRTHNFDMYAVRHGWATSICLRSSPKIGTCDYGDEQHSLIPSPIKPEECVWAFVLDANFLFAVLTFVGLLEADNGHPDERCDLSTRI